MYEIVVGRTPFEANQSEEFLTKDAVECYYQRTLTGNFYGEIDVSTGEENFLLTRFLCSIFS